MPDKVHSLEEPWLIEPVSEDCLNAVCRKAFGPGALLKESRLLTGGQFNTAYYLETRNPHERAVLRIAPPDDRALFTYERGMMLAEPWIYGQFTAAGIPVPATILLDATRTIVDRVYIVQEYIDALPMNHADVPKEVRPGLMEAAGHCIARLHQVKRDAFGWPVGDGTLRDGPLWSEVFGNLLTETVDQSVSYNVLAEESARAVLGIYEKRRAVFDEVGEPVLVHNDIWAPNILVSQKDGSWDIRAIIDADRALFADREFEYILWDKDEFHEDFLRGYGTPLNESPDAVFRRLFYRYYWYLFAAWAYKAQIWRPDAHEWCRKEAEAAFSAILRG